MFKCSGFNLVWDQCLFIYLFMENLVIILLGRKAYRMLENMWTLVPETLESNMSSTSDRLCELGKIAVHSSAK